MKITKNKMVLKIAVMFFTMAFTASSAFCVSAAGGRSIYISASGDDNGNGSEASPLKTISKAYEYVNLYKNSGADEITIYLKGGRYAPITVSAGNSGTADCNITLKAVPGEEVIISDSILLDGSEFTQSDISNNIVAFDLKTVGLTDSFSLEKINYGMYSSIGSRLYIDDDLLTIARYPNKSAGYIKSTDVGSASGQTVSFSKVSERLQGWKNETNAFLGGYFQSDYSYETLPISSVSDNSVTISDGSVNNTSRFFVFNVLSELDEPGEWYIDSDNILYVYPKSDITNSKIELTVSERHLLDINSASYWTFENIIFEASKGAAIYIDGGNNIEIKNCVIRNVGTDGIVISNSRSCTVYNNIIYNTGSRGVAVYNYGQQKNIVQCGILVDNNEIYNFAQDVRTYSPAVFFETVGGTVSHNKIHDAPHQAIRFGLNDNTIEYNEIYNVLSETNDAGAIYCGNSWVNLGNTVRYNKIYDSYSDVGTYAAGIYLDDMMSGVEVYGNVIDTPSYGIVMGGGHYNTISNNIIANVRSNKNFYKEAITADARGMEAWYQSYFTYPNNNPLVENKYIKQLLEVHYQTSDLWSRKYPKMTKILTVNYREPQGNIIENNIIYSHNSAALAQTVMKNGAVSNNNVVNYEFTDPYNLDYSNCEGAISNFSSIPFEEIGRK